jgi:bis(5'-nucleosyl)-tetraphosphatase (symmetrical)
VLFGHWAALGLHLGEGVVGLDSACVWGGRLTALRVDDGQLFQVACADGDTASGW